MSGLMRSQGSASLFSVKEKSSLIWNENFTEAEVEWSCSKWSSVVVLPSSEVAWTPDTWGPWGGSNRGTPGRLQERKEPVLSQVSLDQTCCSFQCNVYFTGSPGVPLKQVLLIRGQGLSYHSFCAQTLRVSITSPCIPITATDLPDPSAGSAQKARNSHNTPQSCFYTALTISRESSHRMRWAEALFAACDAAQHGSHWSHVVV